MNILIIGQHTNNFGDDAAGIALIQRLLEFENVKKINVLYRYENDKLPFEDERVFHYNKNVPSYNARGRLHVLSDIKYFIQLAIRKKEKNGLLLDLLQEADIVYLSPCGADIGSYRDRILLYTLLSCVTMNDNVITHLNTFDDSGQFLFNKIAIHCLKKAKIFVREKRSVKYLSEHGIMSNFGVDSAFMLKNTENSSEKVNEYILVILSEINVWHRKYMNKNWTRKDHYQRVVKPIMEFAEKNDKKVMLAAHTEIDQDFIHELFLYGNEDYPGRCIDKSIISSVYEYDFLISNSYLVIASRYHGIVLSAKSQVPCLGLAYDTKSLEVSEYIDCLEQCVWIQEVMDGKLELDKILKYIEKNREMICKKLATFNESNIIKTVFEPTNILIGESDGSK